MGANDRHHRIAGASSEWGSKGRKNATAARKHSLAREDISDSITSNEIDRMHEVRVENGSEYPTYLKRHKKPSKKWCRRKEGREHQFELLETRKYRWSPTTYVCTVCGKKKYDWPHR